VHLPPGVEAATATAREAVTTAWRTAARHLGEPAAALSVR
ncbi:1-acyl-sn-glycerol-3-phosphate acyltransferase, partial [Streptomyces sp. WAC04770]